MQTNDRRDRGGRARALAAATLLAACAAWTVLAPPAAAQDGPPEHVRRAVDATIAMLQSAGDAALETFADETMAPDADRDRAALLERLSAARAAARGLDDSIAVEREPDGVRIVLSAGGREAQILVALGPDGVVDVQPVGGAGAAGDGGGAAEAGPPGSRDAAIRRHVRALETARRGTAAETRARFERDVLASAYLERTTPAERAETIEALRRASADAGDVRLGERDGTLFLILQDVRRHEVSFTLEPEAPWRIATLSVESRDIPGGTVELTRDNLAETFDRLEREGLSGTIYAKLDGEEVLHRAFGKANRELDVPVTLDTVFGTGSRPIDYTVVAIFLLAQEGKLTLDDPIAKHLDGVPADKRAMTIRQLMTGRSGLPDFFHEEDDWDPDLAWVDRDEAVRRMLAQPLLFAPGSDRQHSHGAFVLLAALVDRISGLSYPDFLRQRIFEPAGMTRTGFYGETLGLGLRDFAAGYGPSSVGLPNIPPNWGPTSWLVMGSGGMVSTLGDLRRFYDWVRESGAVEPHHAARFGMFLQIDGSDRGFELFHGYNPPGNEVILMLNVSSERPEVQELIRALGRLCMPEERP